MITQPLIDPGDNRLAIIVAAPDKNDFENDKLLSGPRGRLVQTALRTAQHDISRCLLVSLEENLFELFHSWRPHMLLGLGQETLNILNPDAPASLHLYHGSLFHSPTFGLKSLTTHDPQQIWKEWDLLPIFSHEVRRAVNQCTTPDLRLPVRDIVVCRTLLQLLDFSDKLRGSPRPVSIDIEGYLTTGISCIGFSLSPSEAFVVPLSTKNISQQNSFWTPHEESIVWRLLAGILEDPRIEKIVQNGLYELCVMLLGHRIVIANVTHDTMLAHHELYVEFPKSLAFQTAFYTHEPYYKNERKATNEEDHWVYNGKDTCVTFECANAQNHLLSRQPTKGPEEHNKFNTQLLYPFAYMSVAGTRFDKEKLQAYLSDCNTYRELLQSKLNSLVGFDFNVKSPKQKSNFLYVTLGLPIQYTGWGPKRKPTTNELALLKLKNQCDDPSLGVLLELIAVRTRISDCGKLTCDPDGRIRCSYNIAGTDTDRLSSSEFLTGAGTNLQNVTNGDSSYPKTHVLSRSLREFFVPDNGFDFFQADLSGADSWTVAAECAEAGDSSMLDDLLFGLKPAKILMVMLDHLEAGGDLNTINSLPRSVLKEKCRLVNSDDWRYLCMKKIQHGTNYDAQAETIQQIIFKDSGGTILLPLHLAKRYQTLYLLRYPGLRKRREWIIGQLTQHGFLTAASGKTRRFYKLRKGQKLDNNLIRTALASVPQHNTTYLTNRALHNLYFDPRNRHHSGNLFVQPLITIHDALAGQWPQAMRAQAQDFLHSHFSNPVKISSTLLTIPFEGGWGESWYDTKNPAHTFS